MIEASSPPGGPRGPLISKLEAEDPRVAGGADRLLIEFTLTSIIWPEAVMSTAKDSSDVVQFMALFAKVRDWTDDTPSTLESQAADDDGTKALCRKLFWAAASLTMNERRRRQLFANPVDPKFVTVWRDYEQRYAGPLGNVIFSDVIIPDLFSDGSPSSAGTAADVRSALDIRWESADDDALEQARAIEEIIFLAEEEVGMEGREFADGHRERLEDGLAAWARLREETGLDLRGTFRRRELVPFVLVPRHVSRKYGANPLSLFTHLQQAHDAFILGLPFAALALMRSILEIALKNHYQAPGEKLAERIERCKDLPQGASKAALHRLRHLANDVLHFESERVRLPKDMEKDLLQLFHILRALIESAPVYRS
jgi:hypothetical protein